MKTLIFIMFISFGLSYLAVAQDDAEGCKDPELFTRMPGYHIYRCEDTQFDRFEFKISNSKSQFIEGHHLFILYDVNSDLSTVPSPIQITRNYTNAAKKVGGQLIYEYEDGGLQNVILKIVHKGNEVWTYVNTSGNQISVHIVEKKLMEQDVVADANSLAKSINETGKVALYGIYFDTGKSVLKPESQPLLQEISKLLKNDPSLKLLVVGHTDNTGTFDSNIKLSLDRANAVVNELISKYQVNAEKLKAWGNGPTSPVATNSNEAGKSLNRRVELVKQ
ncbi:MAG: OmpA family protein [Bacteroidales bacterium]